MTFRPKAILWRAAFALFLIAYACFLDRLGVHL
jgi:hypothetical protein